MDQQKVGVFISTVRKEQNLTQKELAERLGVSDKTVSRWETGNGLPDISIMADVCDVLNVSMNELLSGEKLPPNEYSQKAEENIMALLQENQNVAKRSRWQIIIGCVILVCSICFLFMSLFGAVSNWRFGNYIDGPSLIVFALMEVATVLIAWNKTLKEKYNLLKQVSIPYGMIITLFSLIAIFDIGLSTEVLLVNIAVAILPVLYGAIIKALFAILEVKTNR